GLVAGRVAADAVGDDENASPKVDVEAVFVGGPLPSDVAETGGAQHGCCGGRAHARSFHASHTSVPAVPASRTSNPNRAHRRNITAASRSPGTASPPVRFELSTGGATRRRSRACCRPSRR